MYSLYRAWLSMGPCVPTLTPPPLNLSTTTPTAPDINLQVGPQLINFSAHKAILAAHSGFFKAALTTTNGAGPILVPNINVDEFSSLLTFMYTGYLDLNISNIYNILLATHILHMPRALEICRSFLLHSHPIQPQPPLQQQQQQQQQHQAIINATNIIKPIASRKEAVPHQEVPIFQPQLGAFQKSDETPFKQIIKECVVNPQASTSKELPIAKPSPLEAVTDRKVKTSSTRKIASGSSSSHDNKVIIDIACCDGPVRFHRVVNKYYGITADVENDYAAAAAAAVVEQQAQNVNQNDVLNKVMNANIRDKQLSDENQNNNISGGSNGGEVFTCLYCNHTFKSQYCYQKHARRHLNPVDSSKVTNSSAAAAAGGSNALAAATQQPETSTTSNKREVKLLDMNVQYYPCKTCGSKFPSYYFVHKHRKLCHADEMADKTNKNNEIVKVGQEEQQQQQQSEDSSSKTSIIDVEETNDQ